MYTHNFTKRIRYGETDQMGYLYYGNYALLYEIGRSEAIRSLGISYKQMEADLKIMMPVISVESRYLASLTYDDQITIRTILKEMPGKLIHFYHEIFNGEGQLCHKAEVKLFFIDMETQRRVSAPAYLTDNLKPCFDTLH
ncbi:MAG: acyl-CoA thioesterase [Saprospiraceae bacterium]|nr:acyl-CoA thioesterase [Saprospiraceae bacterium]